MPHYLEVIHDENEDELPLASPYEVPLPSPQPDENTTLVHEINDELEKSYRIVSSTPNLERTLSTSSTVSDASANSPLPTQADSTLSPNVILKVNLPNISENCANDENIFADQIRSSAVVDKLRFYTENNDNNSLLTDGITSM